MSDEPSSAGHEPPPQQTPRQPIWRVLLTPIAVVIGAAIIGGAIILTDDDGGDAVPAGGASPNEQADGSSSSPVAAAGLRETLVLFAEEIGLNTEEFDACLGDPEIEAAVIEQYDQGTSLLVGGTPTLFINNKRIVGAQPTAIINEIIEAELNGSPTSVEEYSAGIQELAAMSPARFAILDETPVFENTKLEGSPDAPVKVIEFSDFQCPFCQRFVIETLPSLRDRVGDEVAFGFAHFPILSLHPNAGRAALAAECAHDQGQFWEMHDLLFERQAAWQDLP